MMRVEKKQNRLWAKRMHSSVKCYKENMQALYMMEKKLSELEEARKKSEDSQQEANQDVITVNSTEKQLDSATNSQRKSDDGNGGESDELPDLDSPSAILLSSTQKTSKTNDQPTTQQPKSTTPQDTFSIDERFIFNLRKIKGLFYHKYNTF